MKAVRALTDEPADADRAQAIIREATLVFRQRGFNGGTTKEIAGRLGLTQPAIYHYLGSKERILVEILLRVADEMDDALEKGLAGSTDPLGQLRGVVAAFTAAVVTNQAGFAVYWNDFRSLPGHVQAELKERERRFVSEVTRLVATAQQSGFAGADPSAALAEAILGMVSWSYRWYRPDGLLDPAELAGVFNRLLGLENGDT